ncbi:rab-GTPase-TBC domain-containing protein [Radiomyces spectabilis]|uniref:rab-GTPase-TBC domain-containing protein n=1 Tax=Radiomyces spectabilis TaxID=64574 RepID=UPI0022201E07|nr:rab-GTPase-TBC domain-containing protein [Radiomyces spectabilis]KAI8384933.1 rab-GTPase-TBC domain-containing protein [Radiomyces spectabilis]
MVSTYTPHLDTTQFCNTDNLMHHLCNTNHFTKQDDHDPRMILGRSVVSDEPETITTIEPSSASSSAKSSLYDHPGSEDASSLHQAASQESLQTQRSITTASPHDVSSRLPQENTRIAPQDSTHLCLAQVECQNSILEKDPKSICMQSNELKTHFSKVQQLISDNIIFSTTCNAYNDENEQEIDWSFWEAVIQDFDRVTDKMSHLLSIKLRAGIPRHVRGLIWQIMSKSGSLHLETVYGQLCRERSPHERIILRDLSRTFPHIDMFKKDNGTGQMAMRRILEAYSLYDANVGYCQGLAFLVGPLLMNMPETQAFCVFVRLMETYEMRSMFTLNMEGLHLRLYQFSSLLSEILPEIAEHLELHAVHAAIYASQWFLTLFAYAFPMALVMRIYDIVFVEGAAETIMRVAIAMIKRSADRILQETEFETLLDYITSRRLCEPYVDDWSQVVHDAMALSPIITRKKMVDLQTQYEAEDCYKDEKTRPGQALTGRFGFWRRRSIKKSKSFYRTKSVCSSDDGFMSKHKPRTSFSSLRSFASAAAIPSMAEPTSQPTSFPSNDPEVLRLMHALTLSEKKHQSLVNELFELKMAKQDVETERDALKMTIIELERHHYSTTTQRTRSPEISLLKRSNTVTEYGRRIFHQSSRSLNDILLTTSTTSGSVMDDTESIDSSRIDLFSNMSDKTSISTRQEEEDNAMRAELVRVKVENFELQQQREKMTQDLDDMQSRLDMVNEGQMALVDQLITIKSDMDDLLQERKRKEMEWVELTEENSALKQQVEEAKANLARHEMAEAWQQQNVSHRRQRRHSAGHAHYISPQNSYLVMRIRELEKDLLDTKQKLAEVENAQLPPLALHHPLSPKKRSPTAQGRPNHRNSMDSTAPGLQRTSSLYGRVWHALSPRYSSFASNKRSSLA